MQLHVARLCLDCAEIHDVQTCPVCGSESFGYISRWIPALEPRMRPRPVVASPAADTFRELLTPDAVQSSGARWLRRGAFGVAAVSVVGWLVRRKAAGPGKEAKD
jgi:predicted  nucleic acid-binding Zn-ribbon protein